MASAHRRVLGEKDVNAQITPSKQPVFKDTSIDTHKKYGPFEPSMFPSDNVENALESRSSRKRPVEVLDVEPAIHTNGTRASPKRSKMDSSIDVDTNNVSPGRLGSPFVERRSPKGIESAQTPVTPVQGSQESQPSTAGSATLVDSSQEQTAAELLRTRLRLAMFKIRTIQPEASLSRLESALPSPMPKEELVIKSPPEKTMRRFYRRTGRISSSHDPNHLAGLLTPLDPRLENEGLTVTHFPQAYTHGTTAAEVQSVPWEESMRSPNVYADGENEYEDSDEDSPPPTRHENPHQLERGNEKGLTPQALNQVASDRFGLVEKDLTSSAVKGRAADSLLKLGHQRL